MNVNSRLASLKLARYRFHWQVKTPMSLPSYASSTLRGVFGRTLKQQVCLTGASDCGGCPMTANCPYPLIFESQIRKQSDHSQALSCYAIETPFIATSQQANAMSCYRPGEHYHFDMVLISPRVIAQLGLIISVWKKAFARGVGVGDGTAELIKVEQCLADNTTDMLYSTQMPSLKSHDARITVPHFSLPADVVLHLKTPMRLQWRGKLINSIDLSPGLFFRQLIRRVSFHFDAQKLDVFSLVDIHKLNALADQVQEGRRDLVWRDWQRYSSRQERKMKFGGLIGRWKLLQVPPQLLPFLYLGQWLHVGKESSFGLGHYHIEWQ